MNEYAFRLSNLYDGFYTPEAKEMVRSRARAFYKSLLSEASGNRPFKDELDGVLK